MHPVLRVLLALRLAVVVLFFIGAGIWLITRNDTTLGMACIAAGVLVGFFAWDYAYHKPSREFQKLLEELLPPVGYEPVPRDQFAQLNRELPGALPNAAPGARVRAAWHKATPAGDLYWGRATPANDGLLTVGFALARLVAGFPFRVDLRSRGPAPTAAGWHQLFRIIWTNLPYWDHALDAATLALLPEFVDYHLTLNQTWAALVFVGHDHGRPVQAGTLSQAVTEWERFTALLAKDALALQPEPEGDVDPLAPESRLV